MCLLRSSGNQTIIQNPDSALHSLAYDGNHNLTSDSFGSIGSTSASSSDALTSFTQGDGGASSVSPQSTIGFSSLAAVRKVTEEKDEEKVPGTRS